MSDNIDVPVLAETAGLTFELAGISEQLPSAAGPGGLVLRIEIRRDAAFSAARVEFERLWQHWHSSPAGPPPDDPAAAIHHLAVAVREPGQAPLSFSSGWAGGEGAEYVGELAYLPIPRRGGDRVEVEVEGTRVAVASRVDGVWSVAPAS